MKTCQRILLCISSSVLLSFGWYERGSGLILLVGLIPLLFVEEDVASRKHKGVNRAVYLYASLTLLIWNILTTWWIKNASFAGLLAAVLVSTFYMALPVMLFSICKRIMGRIPGYAALIIFWLAFEYAYNHGEISWPWLTLGNGFLFSIRLIQWYEITGVFGGSMWILLVNILLYEVFRKYRKGISINNQLFSVTVTVCIILLPVTYSLIRYHTYEEKTDPREIVVVQPNIDPYMKFNDIPPLEQTRIQLLEAAKMVTPETDYVVCPETSIMDDIWIGQFAYVPDFRMVKTFVMQHPRIKYVVGIMCRKRYTASDRTPTSSPIGNTGYYFDTFNSAIQIDSTDFIPIYHKSKLVIGVEKMPYPQYFKILEPLTLQLGGTFRSEGTQQERTVFSAPGDNLKIAPVICYESVYGEFVGDYIKKGANYIFVITNDGWWGDTPGHRQHNALSSLRAIETRRSVARSANTGISCFIDQRGDVLRELTWWKRGALRASINLNRKMTFYVKYGDYIGRLSFYLAVLLLILLSFNRLGSVLKKRSS
jgi:apolipoprotein N-acyltransferase